MLQRLLAAHARCREPSPGRGVWLGPGMCWEGVWFECRWDSSCAAPFLPCRLLKEQEEKENKIASLIAEQSDEK